MQNDFEGSNTRISLASEGFKILVKEIVNPFLPSIIDEIIREIGAERREGIYINWELVQNILACLRKIHYEEPQIERVVNEIIWKEENHSEDKDCALFEKKYDENTLIYYKEQASKWIKMQSLGDYLEKSLKALQYEEYNLLFIKKNSRGKFNKKLEEEFIITYEQRINRENQGFYEMLLHEKFENLKTSYILMKNNEEALQRMLKSLAQYIIDRIETIKKNSNFINDPVQFVHECIELNKRLNNLFFSCLEKSSFISLWINFIFRDLLKDLNYIPSYVAKYADTILTVGLKKDQNNQVEMLNDIVSFVSYINQRDLFLTHYSKFLANRLLNGTSVSKEAETFLLSGLTIECGFNSVNNLHKMQEDINSSKILQTEYTALKAIPNGKAVEIDVKVLSVSNWPEQRIIKLPLPNPLNQCIQNFEEFYKHKESHRQLLWLFDQGNCEIKTNYLPKSYNLISTVFQYAILDQFNNKDIISYSNLLNSIKLPQEDINHSLKCLFHPKRPLIKKENIKSSICQNDENLTLNVQFTFQEIKVALLPTFPRKELNENLIKNAEDRINIDRENILDSIIVKIMKFRKEEEFNQLISEIIAQCHLFNPNFDSIKQRIESLISREFLKRDEKNRNVIIYCP